MSDSEIFISLNKLAGKQTEVADNMSGLLQQLRKSEDEDCVTDDCDPLVCGKCGGVLSLVFGSLPLRVRCVQCQGEVELVSFFSSDL